MGAKRRRIEAALKAKAAPGATSPVRFRRDKTSPIMVGSHAEVMRSTEGAGIPGSGAALARG